MATPYKDPSLGEEQGSSSKSNSSRRKKKKYPRPISYQQFFEELDRFESASPSLQQAQPQGNEASSELGRESEFDSVEPPSHGPTGCDGERKFDEIGTSETKEVRRSDGEAAQKGNVGRMDIPNLAFMTPIATKNGGAESPQFMAEPLQKLSLSGASTPPDGVKDRSTSTLPISTLRINPFSERTIIPNKDVRDPEVNPECKVVDHSSKWAGLVEENLRWFRQRRAENGGSLPPVAPRAMLEKLSSIPAPLPAPIIAPPQVHGLAAPPQRVHPAQPVHTPTRVPSGLYTQHAFAALKHEEDVTGRNANSHPPENIRPTPQNLRYGGYQSQQAPQSRATPLGSGRLQNASKSGAFDGIANRIKIKLLIVSESLR